MNFTRRIAYLTLNFPTSFNSIYSCIAMGGFIPNVSAIAYNVNNVSNTNCYIQGCGVDFSNISGTVDTVYVIAIGQKN